MNSLLRNFFYNPVFEIGGMLNGICSYTLIEIKSDKILESQSEKPANHLLEKISESSRPFNSSISNLPLLFKHVLNRYNASLLRVINLPLTICAKLYKAEIL
jgi:hypothetical protein